MKNRSAFGMRTVSSIVHPTALQCSRAATASAMPRAKCRGQIHIGFRLVQ